MVLLYQNKIMADLFNISDAARIGLHAAMLLAQEPRRRWTIKGLAQQLNCSAAHLAKVLVRLEHAGLIKGKTGPGGGYTLARKAKEINLLQVYQAIAGKLKLNSCPFAVPVCQENGCPLGKFLQGVTHQVVQRLKVTTLADLRINIGGKNADKKKGNQD
ncbi:MAG: Rrf2 family transcriptional regulator [candidate division WOR-3 bacterium]